MEPLMQRTLPRKGKVHGSGRTRTKQPKNLRRVHRLVEGPLDGLWLKYDRDEGVFKGKWVLGFKDFIIDVFNEEPVELWATLTLPHKKWCKDQFEPIPMETQMLRMDLWREAHRSMEFWDKVSKSGRIHHSYPDLPGRFEDKEVESARLEKVNRLRSSGDPLYNTFTKR